MKGQRWASWVVQSRHADPLQCQVSLTCCLESPFLRGSLVTIICVTGTFRTCSNVSFCRIPPKGSEPSPREREVPLSGALGGLLSSGWAPAGRAPWQGAGSRGTGDGLCAPPACPSHWSPPGGSQGQADLQRLHPDTWSSSGSVSPQRERRGFWGTECCKWKTVSREAYPRQSKNNTWKYYLMVWRLGGLPRWHWW